MLDFKTVFTRVKSKTSALLGETASLSYPMADIENGICIDKFFVYSVSCNKMRQRPYALIKAAAQDGSIIFYSHCKLKDFVDTQNYPFADAISYDVPIKSIDEFQRSQAELYALYEDVRKAVFEGQANGGKSEFIKQYLEKLERSVPKALLPYYHALSAAKNTITF